MQIRWSAEADRNGKDWTAATTEFIPFSLQMASRLLLESQPTMRRFGLSEKYLAFPQPTSYTKDPPGKDKRYSATRGHGLCLVTDEGEKEKMKVRRVKRAANLTIHLPGPTEVACYWIVNLEDMFLFELMRGIIRWTLLWRTEHVTAGPTAEWATGLVC